MEQDINLNDYCTPLNSDEIEKLKGKEITMVYPDRNRVGKIIGPNSSFGYEFVSRLNNDYSIRHGLICPRENDGRNFCSYKLHKMMTDSWKEITGENIDEDDLEEYIARMYRVSGEKDKFFLDGIVSVRALIKGFNT